MLWKLFGSEQAVQDAINQSVGYDISPKTIPVQAPANTDQLTLAKKEEDSATKFYFKASWDEKQA